MDTSANSSSEIELDMEDEDANNIDEVNSSWSSSPASSPHENRNIAKDVLNENPNIAVTGKESPEWENSSDSNEDLHADQSTATMNTAEDLNSTISSRNMEIDNSTVEFADQVDEYESNEFFARWTNDFEENLKAIVEVHALAEDVDEVEESNRKNIDDITVELGTSSFDFLDEDNTDEEKENEDETTHSSCFKNLHTFLDNEDVFNTINVEVKISIAELLLMLIKYALIHSLSLSAVVNLFMIINCIFARPIIPDTRYLIDKLFNPLNSVTFHALCPECGIDIGIFKRSDLSKHCSLCNINVDVKTPMYKEFFVTLDPSTKIKSLLETNSTYYSYVMNSRQTDNILRDIYDGKNYRKFVESLELSDRNNFVSATFNTDGAPLFESSAYSIWPIYMMLNELPFSVRSSELIVVGLWFGKSKPNMNIFLKPFVDDMNRLSKDGVKCNIDNEESLIKVFCLTCCVDSIARAPMQGLTQFNGKYGCNWCLHPGKWVTSDANPDCGSHKYPMLDFTPASRNDKDSRQHMEEGSENTPCFGFKNPSRLINLTKFDIIDGFVPDYMHILSGIGKQFANIWFGSSKRSGLLDANKVDRINTILNCMKVPHQVGRLTRSLKDKAFWKAREWENWVLYYSTPILTQFFDKKYVIHWMKLVEGMYILLQSEISIDELNCADILLHEFVTETENLYSQFAMTFNVHLLQHLSESVLNWGPLFCHSAFAFESGNYQLLKSVHAAKGVHQQICRNINLHTSYSLLHKLISPQVQPEVQSLCTQLGTSMTKHTTKLNNARYFGMSSKIKPSWIQKFNLSERARSYKKMVKNGCLYSSSIKNNLRSDNTFAKVLDGSYIRIIKFIVDPYLKKEFVIYQSLNTQLAFKNNYNALKKITSITKEKNITLTDNLEKICVHLNVQNNEYICAVPNLYSY